VLPAIRPLFARGFRALRSPSGVYIVASILGRAGSMLLIPLYTRRLTLADYGVYGLVVSVLGLLPTLFSLGLSAGLAKAYFDEKDEGQGEQQFGAVARGTLAVAGFWLTVGLVSATFFPIELLAPLSRRHVVLLCFAGFGTCAVNTAEYWFRIRERALTAAAFPLASFLLTAGLGILLVRVLGRGLEGAVEAPTLAYASQGVVSAIFVVRRFGRGPMLAATRNALVYSLPFVPHLLAGWLQSAGDRWILGAFGNASALGTYYLATQLMSPVPMVMASWNNGQWPSMGRIYRDEGMEMLKKRLPSWERQAIGLSLLTAIAILALIPVLPLFIGARFLGAAAFMPAIGLCHVFDSLYYPDSNVIYFAGRNVRTVSITFGGTMLALGLAALLLGPLGVSGLLLARVIASLAQMTAFVVTSRRVVPLPKPAST
jgi:O-antigen/teichoic acid export membrane protein